MWATLTRRLQWYDLNKFYRFSYLDMTLVIDTMDGCGISNTKQHERLSMNAYQEDTMVLATKGLPNSSNKMEHLVTGA